jgi:hypothetical protein
VVGGGGGGGGPPGDRDNVNNVQYKSNQNCHYESPPI